MSSSRSRNFRRRAGDDDEDDEAAGGEAPSTISVKAPSKPSSSLSGAAKPKKPQHQAPKLLSFADDEENETPSSRSKRAVSDKSSSRLTKPSSSHKITAAKDRIAHSSSATASVTSNVQPQAGTYTKEALRELQKNTRTLASSSRPSSDSKPSSEPIIVLKGLVKPAEPVKEAKESGSEDEEEDELKEKKADVFRSVKDDAQGKLASIGIANGKSSSGSLFPDEETIKAIRAKRERLRLARPAAPDYISLDGGSNHGAAEGLSDEEPEFRGRIALLGEKIEGAKKGVFEDVDERVMNLRVNDSVEVDEEDDEEEKMWEEEQFRKGLGKRMDEGSTARAGSNDVPVVQGAQQQKFVSSAAAVYSSAPSASISPSIGGAIGVAHGVDVMSISQQAEVAKKALQDNVKRLKV